MKEKGNTSRPERPTPGGKLLVVQRSMLGQGREDKSSIVWGQCHQCLWGSRRTGVAWPGTIIKSTNSIKGILHKISNLRLWDCWSNLVLMVLVFPPENICRQDQTTVREQWYYAEWRHHCACLTSACNPKQVPAWLSLFYVLVGMSNCFRNNQVRMISLWQRNFLK